MIRPLGIMIGGIAILVSGCTTKPAPRPEPEIRIVEVGIPTPVGCIPPNMAGPPVYPDTETALKAAIDAAARYQLLWAGRTLRVARLGEVEPVIAACPKAK